MYTIIEPFRIKMVEPIHIPTREQRIQALLKANYNVFLLDAEKCCIDLLTDSGTGAMSSQQWAAMMLADESYAGSKSWKKFEATIKKITQMKYIFPTHQGRASENILAHTQIKRGDIIPNNSHFDTTRANIEYQGGIAVDLICRQALDTQTDVAFKGNMDINKLKRIIEDNGREKIPFGMITVTNNTGGGQPVSMENIRMTKHVLNQYHIPLVIDACRFAENAYFIHTQEKGYQNKSLLEISQEMFSYADAATMSCKKDGLSNIGGFLSCNNGEWAEEFKSQLILREGFPTYGGLSGRDLEAVAVGLMEALEYKYQVYRHATMEYLGEKLMTIGIPIVHPVGGHAIFIDVKAFLPNIHPLEYPGIGLVNTLYIEGGVRSAEIGSVMFGKIDSKGKEIPAPLELVRLAFPRRVYTQSHFDYLGEIIETVWKNRHSIKGYKITYQPQFLRHFSCHFEPLDHAMIP